MKQFSMLLVNNNRSKSYLQNLIKYGFIPSSVIVLDNRNVRLAEHSKEEITGKSNFATNQIFMRKSKDLNMEFDEKEHILTTLEKHAIKHIISDTLDANSKEVINTLKEINEEFIVYSGPGGTILRKDILSIGKTFIHVHPGWLPEMKGSTTMYYSMLTGNTLGCSVLYMAEELDDGPLLYREKFTITEKNIDFDYTLDPLIRTKTLINFFIAGSVTQIEKRSTDSYKTFHIIHPLLKHIALTRFAREGSDD